MSLDAKAGAEGGSWSGAASSCGSQGPHGKCGPLAAPDRITVVSGLPRSGTSLLMQLLAAAGLDLAQDAARPPDADNPRGYFELAAARRLRTDAGFLEGCRGRVVKIVAPTVLDLDPALGLRLVFIERDLDEVLASQRAMLMRRGEPCQAGQEETLRRAFGGIVARCRARFAASIEAPALFLDHAALLHSPGASIAQVVDFLAATAARDSMNGDGPVRLRPELSGATRASLRAVVEPALHRQRRGEFRDR